MSMVQTGYKNIVFTNILFNDGKLVALDSYQKKHEAWNMFVRSAEL